MQIDWWTLGFQTVNVLVLVWLLKRFLFEPVLAIIARRQARADEMLQAAEAARRDAAAAREAAEAERDAERERHRELIAEAEADARKRGAGLLEAAQTDADRVRREAEGERARLLAAGRRELADEGARLAVDIARRLVDRLPDETRVLPFLPGLADCAAALPVADRRGLTNPAGGFATLVAPRPLTDAERAACETALADRLGAPVTLRVRVDAALVAGLELRGDGVVVRNSLGGDLASVAGELTRHEH